MATQDDVLGVSAQMDITDIINSINTLNEQLTSISSVSKETSAKVTEACRSVASASETEIAVKAKQALDVLSKAFEETKNNAEKDVAKIEGTITRLQERLQKIVLERSDTVIGTKTFQKLTTEMESLNTQIHNQQERLNTARNAAQMFSDQYSHVTNVIATANSSLDAFNAVSSIATSVTTANVVSHGAAAVAVGTEATQHANNTEKIKVESEEVKKNTEAKKENADISAKVAETTSKEEKATESDIDALRRKRQEIEMLTAKIAQYQNEANKIVYGKENPSLARRLAVGIGASNDMIAYSDEDRARAVELLQQVEQMKERLAEAKEEAKRLSEAVGEASTAESSASKANRATQYAAQKEHVSTLRSELQRLSAEYDKLANKNNLTSKQQKELEELSAKIQETKKNLEEATNVLKEMRGETAIGAMRNKFDELGAKVSETKDKVVAFLAQKTGFDELKNKISEVGNSDGMQRFKSEFGQAKEMLGTFTEKISNFVTGGGKVQQALSEMGGAFGSLGAPISAAVTSVRTFTAALWKLCMTPLGAVIAAVVVGLKALTAWFKKSREGQIAYSKITAFVSSLLASLTDILVKVGGYLYHAFADAQGPLNSFANSLVTTLKSAVTTAVKLVTGLGKSLKGLGQMFVGDFSKGWDSMTEGFSDIWEAGKGAVKTIGDAFTTAVKGAKGFFGVAKDGVDYLNNHDVMSGISGALNKAREEMRIAGQMADLNVKSAEAREHSLELDKQIAANREKIYTLTGKEKDALIEETKALLKQKYEGWTDEQGKYHQGILDTQREQLKLTEKQNRMHTMSLESYAKEREMKMGILRTEAQQLASTRMLTRMQAANQRKMDAADKAAARRAEAEEKRQAKAAERAAKQEDKIDSAINRANAQLEEIIYRNEAERIKAETDLEEKIAEMKIKGMRDGFAKTMEERKRQNKTELDAIEEQRKAALEAERKRQKAEYDAQQAIVKARGGKVVEWNNSMFNSEDEAVERINKLYDSLSLLTAKAQIEKEIESEEALVSQYQSYTDKRLAIEKKYANDVAQVDAAIKEATERGDLDMLEALKRTRIEIAKVRAESQAALSLQQLKETPEYIRAFEDLGNTSTETLEYLVAEFEKVKQEAAKSMSPEQLREFTNTLQKMYDELQSRDPFTALKNSLQGYKDAMEQTRKAEERLAAVRDGQQVIKSVSYDRLQKKFIVETWSEAEALKEVARAKDEENKASNNYKKSLEKVTSAVVKLSSSLGELGRNIGGIAGEILALAGDISTFVMGTLESITSLSIGASKAVSAVEKASVILGIVSTAVSLIRTINSLLPTSDDMYDKAAKKQKEINNLRKAVDDYRIAVIKAQQTERSWFSSTGLQSLTNAYEQHGAVVEAYYNQLYEAQEKYQNKRSGLSKSTPYLAAIGAVALGAVTGGIGAAAVGALTAGGLIGSAGVALAVGAAVDGIAGAIVGAAADYAVRSIAYGGGQVAAKDNLRIQTRHKSFWRGEKTQDLSQWVKENLGADLFDDEGLINLQAAETVLDKYGDKLVGETRETLEKLMELREEYDDFIEQLRDYISNTYSPLVDNMTDALWNWLSNGENVMRKFKEYATNTFADIAREMIRQMLLNRIFDGMKTQLESVYKSYAVTKDTSQLLSGILQATDNFLSNAEEQLPVIQDALVKIDEAFAARGFDITGQSSEGSATYKAISSFTQEQGDILNGRLTAIQIMSATANALRGQIIEMQAVMMQDTSQLKSFAQVISFNVSEMRETQIECLSRLAEIKANTDVLPGMADEIRQMRMDINTKL